ncbi:unnamed protein product [Allacma fusca]|uniref:Uncharacterized protein n=1 Tax=Allacma fusca TaxID=39272 RepID=A0A8J2JYE2_9HEXA|nr:unnamed protein product [Allacma fusca]
MILNLKSIISEPIIWNSKHHKSCSYVLLAGAVKPGSFLSEGWIRSLPGTPHKIFYTIFMPIMETNMEVLRENTRYIQHLVLVCYSNRNEVEIFIRDFEIKSLIRVGVNNDRNNKLVLANPYRKYPNYQGNTIKSLVCPICGPKLDYFKETGIWLDYMIATMYYHSLKLNATLEVETIFAVPQEGVDENGCWDEFLKPLLEATAAFSAIVKPTVLNTKVVYFSKPVFYDYIKFIHRLPKKVKSASLSALKHPLSTNVRLGICWDILSVVASFELLNFCKDLTTTKTLTNPADFTEMPSNHVLPHHFWLLTAFATIVPLLDQSGLVNIQFKKNVHYNLNRTILGV